MFDEDLEEQGLDRVGDATENAEENPNHFLIIPQHPYLGHVDGRQDAHLIVEGVDEHTVDRVQPEIGCEVSCRREFRT